MGLGTGNGQAAEESAKIFEKVFATDISQQQIENAGQRENIFYSVEPAEQTNLPDNSFDLVTVPQALHWLRFDDFYTEVKRVAKSGHFCCLDLFAFAYFKRNRCFDSGPSF